MKRFIFWAGLCALVVPAVVGGVLGIIALTILAIAFALLCLAVVAIGAVCVVPLFAWCAYLDPDDWEAAKKFAKHGVGNLN